MNITAKNNKHVPSSNDDSLLVGILTLGGLYLLYVSPFIFAFTALGIGINYITGGKVSIRTIALIIATSIMTIFLSQPAHAVILTDMEAFLVQLAADAGTSISADQVALVFTLMRALFLVLIVIAALFAYNQAQQGNDWRPIATQAGMAIGVLIGIDVITNLFTT